MDLFLFLVSIGRFLHNRLVLLRLRNVEKKASLLYQFSMYLRSHILFIFPHFIANFISFIIFTMAFKTILILFETL